MVGQRRVQVLGYGHPRIRDRAHRRRGRHRTYAPAAGVCGAMRIGDPVTYRGKRYVLRGLDPMGIPDRLADIEDAETGELMRVPVSELVFG
jgi:hypothetical protein